MRQLPAIQLRIPPPCSQRPGALSTPGHIQCVHGSIQRLQLRRRAFHNSLFPGPHALTGPRPPPCNPSHAPSLLFARCLLRPRMLLGGLVPRPPSPSTSLPPRPPSFSSTRRYRYLDLPHPARFHLAAAARRYHSLRSHPVAGAGVLALPCPALPASMSSLTPLDAYSCGAFPLSGVIPTPILAADGWPPTPPAAPRLPQPTNLTLHLPTAPLPLPSGPLVLILFLFGPATVLIAPKFQI